VTESISPSRTWWLGSLDPQRPSLLPLLTSAIAASIVALADARPTYLCDGNQLRSPQIASLHVRVDTRTTFFDTKMIDAASQ
jgi:hypothetical protein